MVGKTEPANRLSRDDGGTDEVRSSVSRRRFEGMDTSPRQLAAVWFADIAGYTSLANRDESDPDAADFVQPLGELGGKVLDFVAPGPYVDVQKSFDANLPKGQRYYSKAHDLEGLTDGAIDTMVEFVPQMVGALSAAYFDPAGGAIGDVDPSATPYAGRTTRYGFHVLAGWFDESEDEAVMSWASQFHTAMAPHATGGVYVNLIADDEADRVSVAYGDNYGRLVELKQKWDPTNLFSNNYNIPPG